MMSVLFESSEQGDGNFERIAELYLTCRLCLLAYTSILDSLHDSDADVDDVTGGGGSSVWEGTSFLNCDYNNAHSIEASLLQSTSESKNVEDCDQNNRANYLPSASISRTAVTDADMLCHGLDKACAKLKDSIMVLFPPEIGIRVLSLTT
jgi:hypothetical protein